MSNIDYLVQNSTKKILDLIRGLPDEKKLEAAFAVPSCQSESSSTNARASRFRKHPQNCGADDAYLSEDDTSASTIKDEVVVIKTPNVSHRHDLYNDSSDECCDATFRTEEPTDFSMSLEDRLGAYHLEHACARSSTSKPKKPLKPKMKRVSRVDNFQKSIKSYAEYEKLLHDLEKQGQDIGALPPFVPGDPPNPPQSADPPSQSSCAPSSPHSATPTCTESQSESMFQESSSITAEASEPQSDEGPKPKKTELKVILDVKTRSMIERSLSVLNECRTIFNGGVEPPDGLEDYERRRKRTYAFASRFSRNYLYQLNRNKTEIESIMKPCIRKPKKTNSYILGQRFYNAFQSIFLALDAYKKHLPTGVVNGMPEKFRELLEMILKFNHLFDSLTDASSEPGSALELLTECCQSMLTDPALSQANRASIATMAFVQKHRGPSSLSSEQHGQKRYSMYSVPVHKDALWKTAVAMQAKQKYQVPSKYMTATFKHRPPPQALPPVPTKQIFAKSHKSKPQVVEPLKLVNSDAVLGKKPHGEKFKMVDFDSDVNTYMQDAAEPYGPSDHLRRFAQGFFDKVSKDQQLMSPEEYDCILDHFVEIVGETKIPKDRKKAQKTSALLERKFEQPLKDMAFDDFVKNLVSYANSIEVAKHDKSPDDLAQPEKGQRSTTVSVSGPDNAKMICMKEVIPKSDSSAEVLQCLDAAGNLQSKLSRLSITPQPHNSNELIYRERGDDDESGRRSLRLDRVPVRHLQFDNAGSVASAMAAVRVTPILRQLPKDVVLRLIEYKLQYHKAAKEHFIYKKTHNCATWLVVDRIADTLMEETLQAISRDIQVDNILQKIYAQEFK